MTKGRSLAFCIGSDSHNNFRLLRLIAAAMVVEYHSHLIRPKGYFGHFHINILGTMLLLPQRSACHPKPLS